MYISPFLIFFFLKEQFLIVNVENHELFNH